MKAARALLAWSQGDLATASGLSLGTIKRLEALDGELGWREATGSALLKALEIAGVVFLSENSDGLGVVLRKA